MQTGKKLRFYPTKEQAEILVRWIGCQRLIYNAKVAEDRYYRAFKRKVAANAGVAIPLDQEYARFIGEETAFLRDVPSQVLRNGAFRWRTAYQRHFKGLAGRPTFKTRHARQSVMLTSELFDISDGALSIGTKKFPVGQIKVPRLHSSFESGLDFDNHALPKTIYVSIEAGRWHVSFSLDDGMPEFSEAEIAAWLKEMPDLLTKTSGFDLGVEVPVATSDGQLHDLLPVQKKRLAKLHKQKRRLQRIAARRQKGSKRRKRALAAAARRHRKMADIRRDFAHKTSRKIVDAPGVFLIGLDGVNIKNMTRSARGTIERPGRHVAQKAGLNRVILASTWGLVRSFTRYKALREHKLAIEVSPAYGSQECSCCGCINPDNRISRSGFVCTSCGFACHADVNAALVAKKRAAAAILSGAWVSKVRRKVQIRKAGTVRMGGGDAVDARGDVVSRKGQPANAQASQSREEAATKKALAV